MNTEISHDIKVTVLPVYIDERSDAENHLYFWAYHVEIENLGKSTVQLINRFWSITDGQGKIEEVYGAGVIGQQPVLVPGQIHEYTSFCQLTTPFGMMAGHYEMIIIEGKDKSANQADQICADKKFKANIPTFLLDHPDHEPSLN